MKEDTLDARALLEALVTTTSERGLVRRLAEVAGPAIGLSAVALVDQGGAGWRAEVGPLGERPRIVRYRAPAAALARAGHPVAPGFLVLEPPLASGGRPTRAAEVAALLTAGVAAARVARARLGRLATVSRRAIDENRELRAELEVSGSASQGPAPLSASMRSVLERARQVARFPAAVLITGESGSGKERIARTIHELSPRRRRPFVAINCGALPPQLLESTLFGHERGAFTGADARHRGIFERAHRGTLLLDEVGELSPMAQTRLLRVLAESEVERVGGEEAVAVDARVIAATHRSLPDRVASGHFREDLFYRLAVFPIHVPPLRERLEDLGPLVVQLCLEICDRLGVGTVIPVPSDIEHLAGYHWPGNVRELANVLESAIILGDGLRLALPVELGQTPASFEPGADPAVPPPLERTVRRAIETALRHTGGKIYGADGAAAILGLKPPTLQSKMRRLGIERRRFTEGRASRAGPRR
jgi:transcriptional regulator with GAF, ATPase, and Fis domain